MFILPEGSLVINKRRRHVWIKYVHTSNRKKVEGERNFIFYLLEKGPIGVMRDMSKRTCQCRASERRVVGPSCGDMIRPHAKPYHNQPPKKIQVLLIFLTNSGRRFFLFPVFFFFSNFPPHNFLKKFQKIGGVHSKIHTLKSTPPTTQNFTLKSHQEMKNVLKRGAER